MTTWSQRFRRRERIRGSLWLVPLLATVLGAILGTLGAVVERHWHVTWLVEYSPSTASTLLTSIVGATAALAGFVVTVSVLVVQMATGTFSPRYMRLWYRGRMLKATLAVIVGTLSFSFALLQRIEQDDVPNLGITVAGILVSVSILVFIFFFDRAIHGQRPVAVAAEVADAACEMFAANVRYADRPEIRWGANTQEGAPGLVVRANESGSIQAVDPHGLVAWARAHDAQLVLARAVGDFVPRGGALILVYGDVPAAAEAELHGMIALGVERTTDQDPAFAIRILVDIAIRALSPAVNDPTTAIQVLNHLGGVLALIGTTDLDQRTRPADDQTSTALVMHTRGWEDFLSLGITEIREYGATSVQVVRRLRAILEELHQTVLPEHRAAVEDELRRLDVTVDATWSESVDLDRASAADTQGLGAPSPRRATADL